MPFLVRTIHRSLSLWQTCRGSSCLCQVLVEELEEPEDSDFKGAIQVCSFLLQSMGSSTQVHVWKVSFETKRQRVCQAEDQSGLVLAEGSKKKTRLRLGQCFSLVRICEQFCSLIEYNLLVHFLDEFFVKHVLRSSVISCKSVQLYYEHQLVGDARFSSKLS